MRNISKKTKENLVIILAPILIIMLMITGGFMSMETLGQWDTAVSLGAIITLLILLVRKEMR